MDFTTLPDGCRAAQVGKANDGQAAAGSQNFVTLFQRDPAWLQLFDPPGAAGPP